jgi:NAD(P)-dependent dehydrogenase (short-subunit alcohol dehydrogenase family)
VRAAIFGASGGLAKALAHALLEHAWQVDLVTRKANLAKIQDEFNGDGMAVHVVERAYAEFTSSHDFDAYFFPQALFAPKPLIEMSDAEIAREIEVGFLDVIQAARKLLAAHPAKQDARRDYCFVGSTSAYAGFKNTSVYCAVKHGLLGFVRAMNDEYAQTGTRFWLFSMGTMDTSMGRKLVEQDPSSFLNPKEVAERMVDAIASRSNLFEPEVILRRRTIRFREK